MEIITMESAAYKDIVGRIEEIASHVRKQGMEGQRNDTACLLDSREVMRLLCVSRRTLQWLRDEKRILQEELDSVEENLEVLRNQGKDVSRAMLRGLEKRKINLQAKLEKVEYAIKSRTDDVVDFKQMGIDHLFVDESHQFKNLTFNTRHDRVAGLGTTDEKAIGKRLQEIAKNATTGGQPKRIGELYGFPVKVVSERTLSEGLEFTDNRFFVEGNYRYTYNNGHLAMADTHAAAVNFLNALEKIPSVLAALDRKIQLELAPKHGETPDKGQEQGGGQDLPKAENVPKPDDAARDYIRDHIIIGRPGIPERREGHGMKM